MKTDKMRINRKLNTMKQKKCFRAIINKVGLKDLGEWPFGLYLRVRSINIVIYTGVPKVPPFLEGASSRSVMEY
jgi:hypothetical protein